MRSPSGQTDAWRQTGDIYDLSYLSFPVLYYVLIEKWKVSS